MAYIRELDWQVLGDDPVLRTEVECMTPGCPFMGTLEDCRRLAGAFLCPRCGARVD